mmetsp:Transcript_40048/g.72624  ORF Transcript_40048/g.72624 Transcript_40048/m.72624 type:complete len:214 (+) Transcript_40048:724-1365(+)
MRVSNSAARLQPLAPTEVAHLLEAPVQHAHNGSAICQALDLQVSPRYRLGTCPPRSFCIYLASTPEHGSCHAGLVGEGHHEESYVIRQPSAQRSRSWSHPSYKGQTAPRTVWLGMSMLAELALSPCHRCQGNYPMHLSHSSQQVSTNADLASQRSQRSATSLGLRSSPHHAHNRPHRSHQLRCRATSDCTPAPLVAAETNKRSQTQTGHTRMP